LAVYNNEFLLGSAHIDSENRREATKSLEICNLFRCCFLTYKLINYRTAYNMHLVYTVFKLSMH